MNHQLRVALASLLLAGAVHSANFEHLDHLSQEFMVEGELHRGVWIYAEPGLGDSAPYIFKEAPGEGVTDVDDVARSAIAYMWAGRDDYARDQLAFLLAMQDDSGSFFNFVFEDGSINRLGITSRAGTNFWSARALWAIGEGLKHFQDDAEFRVTLRQSFMLGLRPFAEYVDERYGTYLDNHGYSAPAWFPGDGSDAAANLLLGLAAFLEVEEDQAVERLARQIAAGIAEFQYGPPGEFPYLAHPSFARDPLVWHAWGSRQSQALARAGQVLDDPELIDSAVQEAAHFFVHLLVNNGPVELMQPAVKPAPQIAYGMETLASGEFAVADATGREVFDELGGLFTSWLHGNNMLRTPMYDPATGRTYDGLEGGVINRNAGAESTITALLALVQAEARPAASTHLDWTWVWQHADLTIEAELGLDFGEPARVESDTMAGGQLVAVMEPGTALTIDSVIPATGLYRVLALFRDEPWAASAAVSLGQTRLGTVSTSLADESRQVIRDLGVHELGAGDARFVLSHQSGDTMRFDALVLRPVLSQKLFARPGDRMLLVKGWNDSPVELDAEQLIEAALGQIGGTDYSGVSLRVFDRYGVLQNSSQLPAFGFAVLDFRTGDPLPDLQDDARTGVEFTAPVTFGQDGFVGLDLSAAFNNDAFSDSRNPAKGNFDSRSGALGATYPAERAPDPSVVVELVGVPWLFPPTLADANNISLKGQTMLIDPGEFSRLHVLGASEQGNYTAPVLLHYADGTEQVELALSDWCQQPRFGEQVAVDFQQRRGATGTVERINCRILAQVIELHTGRTLEAITFPDRETMHVFALTLEQP